MTPPREFTAVLASVIAEVPEDEPAFRSVLAHVAAKARRTAPEIHWQVCGVDAAAVIRVYAEVVQPSDVEGWRGRVIAAWAGAAR